MTNFTEIVEAADQLSVEEQTTLMELLQRRIATRNRESLVRDVAEAHAEFKSGQLRPTTTSGIIADALDVS